MEKISEWINGIIEDIADDNKKLSSVLLKVQVLAHRIKNDNLENWVNSELNGFIGLDKPSYRKIPVAVMGRMYQDRGFAGAFEKIDFMPVEKLDADIRDYVSQVEVSNNLAELENMSKKGKGKMEVNLSHYVTQQFNKLITNWHVDRTWQIISIHSIEGMLLKIKSSLLNFLLILNEEYGNNDNISIMKKKADKIFDQTIGEISGGNISISLGGDSSTIVNNGDNSIVGSENSTLKISSEKTKEIDEFLSFLNSKLQELNLTSEDEEEIKNEVVRVQTQIKRDSPKFSVVNNALDTIKNVLTGVASNQVTPVILEKLNSLIGNLC